jgi:Family of unknown function (DUF5681)
MNIKPSLAPAENTAKKQRGRPFEPGKSGNPNGRPKGSRNKTTLAIEALLDGESEAITRTLLEKALEGDMTALRLCLERLLWPTRDRPVAFDLPPVESAADAISASSSVLAACAAGILSPGEAAQVMDLISTHVRMLAAGEIEARLSALEKERKP